jgi:hypothetical protein
MSDEQKTGDSLFSFNRVPMTNREVSSAFLPDPDEMEEDNLPITKKQPSIPSPKPMPVIPQTPAQMNVAFDLPPARPAKRRRSSEKSFSQKHVTISLSIDHRIANEVDEFLDRGARLSGNKTVFASQLFLKLLLNAGYKLDPNMLAESE